MNFTHNEVVESLKSISGIMFKHTHKTIKKFMIEKFIEENGIVLDGDDSVDSEDHGKFFSAEDEIKTQIVEQWNFIRRPDAFKICKICATIHIYEISDYHRISDERLAEYHHFFDWLGEYGINGFLYVVNRHGTITVFGLCELLEAYARTLKLVIT